MAKKKICLVTGARSDYNLLQPVAQDLRDDANFELQIVATGMHLAPEFGLTYRTIEADGFEITAKVHMLLASDTPEAIAKSIGLGTIGFAEVLPALAPDMLFLVGDRFETLAAAQAALVTRIPIAHFAGGDTTEGAFDEAIRHSITKMAHLHFVTNADAARRVRQMGENPEHIFNVGTTQIDCMLRTPRLGREEIERRLGMKLRERNLLITFHPVTLLPDFGLGQLRELLSALDKLDDSFGLVFTKPNADTAGRLFVQELEAFVARHGNAVAHTSLGAEMYYSVMSVADAVVGNSSSGLYEAPTLKIPTVDVGDRQKGRPAATSVVHCEGDAQQVLAGIQKALALDCSQTVNPYGNGHAAEQIVNVLRRDWNADALVRKHFFDCGGEA